MKFSINDRGLGGVPLPSEVSIFNFIQWFFLGSLYGLKFFSLETSPNGRRGRWEGGGVLVGIISEWCHCE